MPDARVHPTPQDLTAFALGKMPDAQAAALAAHLDDCPDCRRAVEQLPPDSFLAKVCAARPNQSSRSTVPPEQLPTPPADLPPALARHPKYRVVRELGRGGMGVVYEAVQPLMDRPVALKVITPAVLARPGTLSRFRAEVKAAARLDHPNIVRAYDAEQVGDLHVLVMEFIEGRTLADLVRRQGALPVAEACRYVHQAALGLQHAFEQGLVHRDVKPQNLMVTATGQVKVLDFGLARLRGPAAEGGGLTDVGAFMGTPEYVAPEQAEDARTADTRADLYSLGCTLYFLLTGRTPFPDDTLIKQVLAHRDRAPTPLPALRPDVPAALAAVVARLLEKDPARRFQRPVELAEALTPFLRPVANRGGEGRPPSSPASVAPGGRTVTTDDTHKDHDAGKGAVVAAVPVRRSGRPLPLAWVGVALLALGVALLAGVVIKTRVTTADGPALVVLEIEQADAEVSIDGQKLTVHIPGDNQPVTVEAGPGRHQLLVSKAGFKADAREVEFKAGKNAETIRVRLEPLPPVAATKPAAPQPAPVPGKVGDGPPKGPSPTAATKPAQDHFPPGSVWKGKRTYLKGAYAVKTVTYELHVEQCDGTKFTGTVFDNGPNRNRADVEGEVNGNILTWRERPRHMVATLTMRGVLDGDRIQVTFNGNYGNGKARNEGDGELKRAPK